MGVSALTGRNGWGMRRIAANIRRPTRPAPKVTREVREKFSWLLNGKKVTPALLQRGCSESGL